MSHSRVAYSSQIPESRVGLYRFLTWKKKKKFEVSVVEGFDIVKFSLTYFLVAIYYFVNTSSTCVQKLCLFLPNDINCADQNIHRVLRSPHQRPPKMHYIQGDRKMSCQTKWWLVINEKVPISVYIYEIWYRHSS